MHWEEEYKRKLVTPDEAVKEIKSGDTVSLGIATSAPYALCQALGRRKDELEGVTINTIVTVIPEPWFQPGYEKAFRVVAKFLSPMERGFADRGEIETLLLANSMTLHQFGARKLDSRKVYMCIVSPPDQHGCCSFGEMLWYAPNHVESADMIIAEVTPGLIRTYGENHVHVSQIDRFVETDTTFKHDVSLTKKIDMVIKDEQEQMIAEIIGATVAGELIQDGDVIQIGAGSISGAIAEFLHDKNDLGFHSEIIPGGIVKLMKEGVITGRTKKNHKGKVVAAGCFGNPKEDLDYINENRSVELYRITYVNDPRIISANDHAIAINNALAIDLSGQIASDSLGPGMYSGPGGQLDFAIGAMYSDGGRFISILPSTANGGKASRIVPTLAPGQGVTVPRYLADYVVTEHGIASLYAKTFKQRAHELISIAHPDFRDELKDAAKRMGYW